MPPDQDPSAPYPASAAQEVAHCPVDPFTVSPNLSCTGPGKNRKPLFRMEISWRGTAIAPIRFHGSAEPLPSTVKESNMPTPAYMTIEGTKQGLITAGTFTEDSVGNIFQEGHEDQILVQAFDHQVIIPRDPQSGQPTGQRVHKPLMITKVFDKSSPLLFNALTSGERLNKCRLEWYRTSAQVPRSITSPSSWKTPSSSTCSRACPTARTRHCPISPTWKTCTSPTARSSGPMKCQALPVPTTGAHRFPRKSRNKKKPRSGLPDRGFLCPPPGESGGLMGGLSSAPTGRPPRPCA